MSNKYISISHSVNVIGYEKEGIKYGASIAWGSMVDYDKMIFLMGSQSVTGKNLNKGDIVGVSHLAENQMNIAERLGDGHSDCINKFEDIEYSKYGNALLIKDSCANFVCEVIDILHLEEIEEDNLIYVRVLKSSKIDKKPLFF